MAEIIIKKDTVYNIFNAPKGKACPHGEEVYEWEYLDENGKLQKESKNVKEEINSFLPFVDYKAQIARGELEENGTISTVSKDYRNVPDSTVDMYNNLAALASLPQEQITKLMEQINQTGKDSVQGEQVFNQNATAGGKALEEVIQDKSTDSKSNTVVNGGEK